MSEAKHTPGPWGHKVERHGPTDWNQGTFVRIAGDSGPLIASFDASYEAYPELPELKANVRLMAAAPDLLEALTSVIRGVPDTWEGVHKARAAIAKATQP